MKGNCFLLIVSLLFSVPILAQDKDDIAKALYAKAESSYTSEKYDEALKYLNDCESTLGSTNSKILYLKVNALNKLYIISGENLAGLKFALDNFFEITDKSTYPSEKYSDIVNIKIDLPSQIKEREQIAEQQPAYSKLKTSNSKAEFEEFFRKYPKSKYDKELHLLYNLIVADTEWDLEINEGHKIYKSKLYFKNDKTATATVHTPMVDIHLDYRWVQIGADVTFIFGNEAHPRLMRTYKGTITGQNIAGTWTDGVGDHGTWSADKK